MPVLSLVALLLYELELLNGSNGALRVTSFHACIVLLSEASSSSHFYLATGRQIAPAPVLVASGKPSTWLPLVELAELPPSCSSVTFQCTSLLSTITNSAFLEPPRLSMGYTSFPWIPPAVLGCLWYLTPFNHDIR